MKNNSDGDDWVSRAHEVFAAEKPTHFTDPTHCDECAEHDATLLNATMDTISLAELGNPGWDPICFCSAEGIKYYMPALIRLSLESVDDDFYFSQFLFHLDNNGKDDNLKENCSLKQREYFAQFVAHMIQLYPDKLDQYDCSHAAIRVHEAWSK